MPSTPSSTGSQKNYSTTPPPNKQRILRGVRDIPALPQVVTQVVGLLNKPSSSSSQIADLISYDPGLTSRILRMINSSAYGIPRQVTSIQHSIAMLGYNAVRGLVLGASICQLFSSTTSDSKSKKKQGLDLKGFWQHALLTAFFAKHLAEHFNLPEADDIFSAGMLHNIGILGLHTQDVVSDVVVHNALAKKKIWRYDPQALPIEYSVLAFTHVDLGSELAQRWQLPKIMQAVMSRYNRPVLTGDETDSAVFTVALAHYLLALVIQVDYHFEQIGCAQLPDALCTFFRLETNEDVQALCEHIAPLLGESEEIMQSLLGG
jgi:HD-like signal output (HDOD) protein